VSLAGLGWQDQSCCLVDSDGGSLAVYVLQAAGAANPQQILRSWTWLDGVSCCLSHYILQLDFMVRPVPVLPAFPSKTHHGFA
jgi:hypothetical protein